MISIKRVFLLRESTRKVDVSRIEADMLRYSLEMWFDGGMGAPDDEPHESTPELERLFSELSDMYMLDADDVVSLDMPIDQVTRTLILGAIGEIQTDGKHIDGNGKRAILSLVKKLNLGMPPGKTPEEINADPHAPDHLKVAADRAMQGKK